MPPELLDSDGDVNIKAMEAEGPGGPPNLPPSCYKVIVRQLNSAIHIRETEINGLAGRPEMLSIFTLNLPPAAQATTDNEPAPDDPVPEILSLIHI